jgi:hypothetical protein
MGVYPYATCHKFLYTACLSAAKQLRKPWANDYMTI